MQRGRRTGGQGRPSARRRACRRRGLIVGQAAPCSVIPLDVTAVTPIDALLADCCERRWTRAETPFLRTRVRAKLGQRRGFGSRRCSHGGQVMRMLSLVELLRSPVDILCYYPGVHTLRRESAVVERVMITDADWRLSEVEPGRAVLAVIPADGANIDAAAIPRAIASLVEQGVTAMALMAGDVVTFPDGIEREAARRGVPVLVPVRPENATAERIRSELVDFQVTLQEAHKEQIACGARLATELEYRDPENAPARLTRWLAGEMAREAATAVRATSERPPDIIKGNDAAEEAYRQLREGKRPTAHVPGKPHVLLNRASATRPFEVLVAASPWGWTPHLVDLAQQTARHIVYSQGVAVRRQIRKTELAVRVGVVQQLLTGDVAHARRAAARAALRSTHGPGRAHGRSGVCDGGGP